MKESSADCGMATKVFTSTPVAENTAKVVGVLLDHWTFWAMVSAELVGASALDKCPK